MTELLNKIKSLVSNDLYKNALKVIESELLFCKELEKNIFELTFIDKEKKLSVISVDLNKDILERASAKQISVNELSGIIHYFNNTGVNRFKELKSTSLRKELKIDRADLIIPSAILKIDVKNSSLHATSSWEFIKISISVLYKNKSYIGNSNRLRQLRLDETKSNSIKFQDFSLQDRQIIRFLTQYAEPDGNDFSLNSDLFTEFLHCFNENKNIYINNNPIIIHSDSGKFIGLIKKDELKVYPGLSINNKILPISGESFIAGKCGFWLSYFGEYWWTPIAADMVWMRNFLMSEGMAFDSISKIYNLPFPVIEFTHKNIQYLPCTPIYYINYSEDQKIIISLKFKYSDKELSISDFRLDYESEMFWKRDKLTENSALNGIKILGFKPETGHLGHFSIYDTEQKGLFLNEIIPKWINSEKHIFMSPESADMKYNLYPLKIYFSNSKQKNGFWIFDYLITNRSGGKLLWSKLVKSVKNNRKYIELDNGYISEIPDMLNNFIKAFQGIITAVKKNNRELMISNAALLYLIDVYADVIEEIPKEWKKKNEFLTESEFCIMKAGGKRFNGELRNYQLKAVNWMCDMLKKGFNSVLADEMGLGKTIQALALVNILSIETKNYHPCMVVCPTSLVENWKNEAELFTPDLKVEIISGNKRDNVIENINKYDLVITSYSLIKRDIDNYNDTFFSLIILDEAQHIKNPSTINAKVCKSLNANHRLVLTGTPLENSPEDIWSIFDFLNPGMLGNNESFKRMYSGIENDQTKQKELADRIAPFILRRHKREVEQIPEKTEKTLYCQLLPGQQKLYDSIMREGKTKYDMFASGKSTRFDILSSLTRLRQLCCHPDLLPALIRKDEHDSAKMDLLKELILETVDSNQKTLVFSQFTSLLRLVRKWLDERNIIYQYLDGATTDRQSKVDKFNSDKSIKLFLLSLKAGGIGLNLTSAVNVIICDPWWNPTAELQAADRIHRIGQKESVTIYKLVVKDSIEEKIIELQKKKLCLFNGIVENSSGVRKLTDKDLAFLFK